MKYDLFISDYDGTLGSAPDYIAPETVSAIKKYCDKGGIFAVCSGRMMASILPICRKYDLKGLAVAYQGAMINDIVTGKNLFTGGMDTDISAEIAEYFIKRNVSVIAEIDDVMYYSGQSFYIGLYEKNCSVKGVEKRDIVDFILKNGRTVQKVIGLCGAEETKTHTPILQRKYAGKVLINNGASILAEVVSPTCSKKVAVEFLANYYGVPLDKVLAVGDSTNDIELLRGAWHGVAVGDGREELKEIADEITVPFNNQPVKYLLEKYCL